MAAPSRRQAIKKTVQAFHDVGAGPTLSRIILQAATAADEAPSWWSQRRDDYLSKFWPTEPFLAGAIYAVSTRNASFRWELHGTEKNVWRYQALLNEADFGGGWQAFIMKITNDLLTAGNGAFVEIIRPARARTRKGIYDAVKAVHPKTGDMQWVPYDRHSGKLMWRTTNFKLIDSPRDLPVGIAHLDAHRCLGRDSRILMADGSSKSILSIVRERDDGLVLAMDANGKLVPRRIIGWHESPLSDRYWLHIGLLNAGHTFGRHERLWLTNDHEVMTSSGWKRADCLSVGDKVVTPRADFSLCQKQFLAGTLLGDGGLAWTSENGFVKVALTQGKKQIEWLQLKRATLSNLGWCPIRWGTNYCHSYFAQSESHVTPALNSWRDKWYPCRTDRSVGLKRVPKSLVEQLFSPMLLATWYLDDGNLQKRAKWGRPAVRLYTNGFAKDDVEWLASLLRKHGYDTHVYSMKGKYALQYYLHLTPDASEKFFATVAAYIPSCMRYKLPDGYSDFNTELWESIDKTKLFVDTVDSIETGNNGDQVATFCIDVEGDHNFVAANMVVHNCTRTGDPNYPVLYTDIEGNLHKLAYYQVITLEDMPSPRKEMHGVGHSSVDRCLRLAQILRDMSIYKHEKVSGRFARAIYITNADALQMEDAIKEANASADSKGLIRYSQPVILNTVNPTTKPEVAVIPLASLPESFSEDETMRWYIAGVANALGVDYGFLAPLPGNKMGTADQAETQAEQARGKSSRLFMETLQNKFNYAGLFPRTVQFKFAYTDPGEESQRDRGMALRARTVSILIEKEVIPPPIARQLLADWGDLDPKYLAMLGEIDLTPMITIGNSDVKIPQTFTSKLDVSKLVNPWPSQSSGSLNTGGDGGTPGKINVRTSPEEDDF